MTPKHQVRKLTNVKAKYGMFYCMLIRYFNIHVTVKIYYFCKHSLNHHRFQTELVARFPPAQVENLPVWRHVLLRALSQEVRLHVELDVVNLAQSVLKDWENGGYRLGQVDKVVRATSSVEAP